jgi:hypothetical protein
MKLNEIVVLEENYGYPEFVRWATAYEENRVDEFAIPAAIKAKIDFVKKLATDTKFKFSDLLKLFKNKQVFKFFALIKFSFSQLHKLLKQGFKIYQSFLDAISDFVAKSGVGQWTTERLKDLDQFLKSHPKLRRVAGVAIAALLMYIWFNMTFTGDPNFDFDMTDLLAALAGKFTLSTLFGGTQGTKLLLLFATGVIGLSFPWPGPARVQFVIGIVQTLAQKVRVRLSKSREPIAA